MNESLDNERAVHAELAELREALRALPLPPADEAAMRSAFRARQRALASAAVATGEAPRTRRVRRAYLAVAASAALAVLGAAVVIGLPGGAPSDGARVASSTVSPAAVAATEPAITAFQPLMHSPGFTPTEAYSVVRVRIPLSSLALVPGTVADGSIEAELLVGEDGLARGIRFNSAAAAQAAAAVQR